ncbi:MAG: D-glycero-beta-D-manno-heptose 1,7-bisphosphate 7-phosphatase [Pseudomonadota bacterium]
MNEPSSPQRQALASTLPDLDLILLDRDGVLNAESEEFIKSPSEWTAISGAAGAVAQLQSKVDVAVCTNQSGIARGLFSPTDLEAIHKKLQQTLSDRGAKPIDIFYCPHGPDDNCLCRKPLPGLLHAAMGRFDANPDKTLFVGDSIRDLEAGLAAGCHVALVLTGNGQSSVLAMSKQIRLQCSVWQDLAELAGYLVKS